MARAIKLFSSFLVLFIFVVLLTSQLIKPFLVKRLQSRPPADYNEWFVRGENGTSLRIKRDLSGFVREKYRSASPHLLRRCRAYLHVFAHTSAGKPLVVLFHAKDGAVIQTRFLDDKIDPTRWHYKPRIDDRCIEDVDRWRDYFVDVSAGGEAMNPAINKTVQDSQAASPRHALETLASRYRYQIIYSTRQGRQPERVIVVRFTDGVTLRSWDFELTGVSWHPLREYTDKPVSHLAITDSGESDRMDRDNDAITRLKRLIPVSWLTRPDNESGSDITRQRIDRTNSHSSDPCWSETSLRSVTGKRAVTLHAFYYYYLRGLQLPAKDEHQSTLIQDALSRMYFDCHYDKDTPSGLLSTVLNHRAALSIRDASAGLPPSHQSARTDLRDSDSPSGKTAIYTLTGNNKPIDAVLYPVVASLRICAENQRFDERQQRCQ